MNSQECDLDFYRKAIDSLCERFPVLKEQFYPRRTIPVQGYINPLFSSMYFGLNMVTPFVEEDEVRKTISIMSNLMKRSGQGCRTFFLDIDFLTACLSTKIPDDFFVSDLNLPFDSFVFLIPDAVSENYFGEFHIPFVGVCKAEAGEYLSSQGPVVLQEDRFLLSFLVVDRKTGMIRGDFTGVHRLDEKIVVSSNNSNFSDWSDKYDISAITPEEQEKESKLYPLLNSLVFKVLLILNSEGSHKFFEQGSKVRNAKINRRTGQILRTDLWSPNFIGKGLFVRPKTLQDSDPSGQKMCFHWRSGHLRKQPYGPRSLEVKKIRSIWIRPVLVNDPAKESEK